VRTRAEVACTRVEETYPHPESRRTSLEAACAQVHDAHSPIDFVRTHLSFERPLGARGLPHVTNIRPHVARCLTAIAFAIPLLPLPQQSSVCANLGGTTRVLRCRSRNLGFRSRDSSSRSRHLTPSAARLAWGACHRRPRAALLTSGTRCLTPRSPDSRCHRREHKWQIMGAHVARRVRTPEEWRLLTSATDHLMSDMPVLTCETPRLPCQTLDR
jgi:hypothetical protein